MSCAPQHYQNFLEQFPVVYVPTNSWHLIMCFVTVCLSLLWYCSRNILQSSPFFLLYFSTSIPSRNKMVLGKRVKVLITKNNNTHSIKWMHTKCLIACDLHNYLSKVCIKSTEVCLHTLPHKIRRYITIWSPCGNYILLFNAATPYVWGSLLNIARHIWNIHSCFI
jgi:hypothetical protein